MSTSVGHDTDAMRKWSGNIETSATEYDDAIKSLYNLVDNFVSADFTGGLSLDFENAVLNQRKTFNEVYDTLNDCAELIKDTSTKIDSDEEELKSSIASANVFND